MINTLRSRSILAITVTLLLSTFKTVKGYDISKKRIVLTGPLHAGTGNQIEGMVEQLTLVRAHSLEYVLPFMHAGAPASMTGENDTNKSDAHVHVPPEEVWDMKKIRARLSDTRLHTRLPAECDTDRGGWTDIEFLPTLPTVRGPRNAKLYVYPASNRNDSSSIIVRCHRQGLEARADFRNDIIEILSKVSPHQRALQENRAFICIRLGAFSTKPDMSLMPTFRAVQKYNQEARKWPLYDLGVVHLRYDEHRCKKTPPGIDARSHICVLLGNTREIVWPPVDTYCDGLTTMLAARGARWVYITKSPFVPEELWERLQATLRPGLHGVRLAASAAATYHREQLSWVEREIATEARLFVAEHSSWSRTIAYTRGTANTTVFAADMFEKAAARYRRPVRWA
jgi:hypothetical protein